MTKLKSQERGFTLIELMISLTLGMIILLAIVAIYVRSSTISHNQDQGAAIQDNARFALTQIGNISRLAGFNLPVASAITISASGSYTDVLTVRYQASTLNASATTMQDCQGNTVPTNTTVTNTFYVGPASSGRALYCQSSLTASATAIANNIEAMKLRVGYSQANPDSDPSHCVVSEYLNPGVAPADSTERIMAIKVGLLTRSDRKVLATDQGNLGNVTSFNFGFGSAASAVSRSSLSDTTGQYLYRIFNSTFVMRNACSN